MPPTEPTDREPTYIARRVTVVGRNCDELYPLIQRLGLILDHDNPEAVITYGGDGTLLGAEREMPGVPKVALRDSRHCRTCSHPDNGLILQHLAEGTLRRTEFMKLQADGPDESRFVCLNNVILRNAHVAAGVRYRVWIDDEAYGTEEIVGDGLVVSTPFGSAAYYRSITHSTFRVGIGLAFNNSIEPINHLVLDAASMIRVQITRGPAVLAGDQEVDLVQVARGDEILIRRSAQNAVVLAFDRVRYPADRFLYQTK